ncbi:MAG: bifunctional homocysteine S-methyltransferase/methylenetetrahydrofolate reductase [Streptosporangiales bacterium]|nr:bifunctional homocysteine S-methyltransferase/methylenetetrahydrofolate reductase [Streptosporangiales bacterium]
MTFLDELGHRLLIGDGAMGTMLHAAGNSLDLALPELNVSNADLVSTVHESYLSVGADVLTTNTFGANRLRLAGQGHALAVREINLAGVRLARRAARSAGRPVYVAGSLSPAVTAGQRRKVAPADRAAAVREQVEALLEGGVDVLLLETFGHLEELTEAVEVAAGLDAGVPVIAQATFTSDGRTLGGESPHEVATALAALPVAAIGTNCTLGPQAMLEVVRELRRATTLPLTALPNAGLPRRVRGRRFEYNIDGAYVARYALRYAEAGAALVGGCCGTTPSHIQAVSAALGDRRERRVTAVPRAPAPRTAPPEPADHDTLAVRLAEGRQVLGVEVRPAPGGLAEETAELVVRLRDRGAGLVLVSPTESPRAQPGSVNLALHLGQSIGVTAVPAVPTWDKTIMTLQADLLGAHALGVRSVVCETGNPPLRGDYPNVDGIWEVDSVGLIGLLEGLNRGHDSGGLPLATKTGFHIGARFNPGSGDPVAELARTREKLLAGAQFLISRPVYEASGFLRMAEALGGEVPLLVTVAPLRDYAEAEFLAHEVPDVTIPEETLRALDVAGPAAPRVGRELAAQLVRELRPAAAGLMIAVGPGPADQAIELLGEI